MEKVAGGQAERGLKARRQPGVGFEAVVPNPKLKLLEQVREVKRLCRLNFERSTSNVQHRTANIVVKP